MLSYVNEINQFEHHTYHNFHPVANPGSIPGQHDVCKITDFSLIISTYKLTSYGVQ